MKLLIVEDQPSLLDAVSVYMTRQGFVVDQASNLKIAQSYVNSGGYDGIFLDLGLPDGNGADFLKQLRAGGFVAPIILMTARDQISDRIKGLDAGADDYVVKPFDLDELHARFHAVLRRYQSASTSLTKLGIFEIDRSGHRLLRLGEEVGLTAKEWALIERLTRHPNAVVPKESLEETLYSIDHDVMSNTLEVHISRIRKKIGKEHIETHRNLGYRFIGAIPNE
ncbi:MAG: response regulator [Rhodocyclaceae bacterium]|jgi:two-component system OmpR family response regulator|nr:response regulator [Rhodocyclaceae bacterium]